MFLWRGYGAVCPGMVTTNGSIALLVETVAAHVREHPDRYPISESILPEDTDFASEEKLKDAVLKAWESFKNTVREGVV